MLSHWMLLCMIVSGNSRFNMARNNEIMNLKVLSEAQHFKKFTRCLFFFAAESLMVTPLTGW